MKRIVFISFLILSFAFNLFGQTITKDEYSIYALALKNIYEENFEINKLKTSFVILDETYKSVYSTDEPDAANMKGLSEDFGEKNKAVVKLERRFPTAHKYDLVSENDVKKLLNDGEAQAHEIEKEYAAKKLIATNLSEIIWKPFDRKHPDSNGYYEFSRIGFSNNKRFALVEILGKGAYWSSNTTFILVKKNGRWKIVSGGGGRGIV